MIVLLEDKHLRLSVDMLLNPGVAPFLLFSRLPALQRLLQVHQHAFLHPHQYILGHLNKFRVRNHVLMIQKQKLHENHIILRLELALYHLEQLILLVHAVHVLHFHLLPFLFCFGIYQISFLRPQTQLLLVVSQLFLEAFDDLLGDLQLLFGELVSVLLYFLIQHAQHASQPVEALVVQELATDVSDLIEVVPEVHGILVVDFLQQALHQSRDLPLGHQLDVFLVGD